MNTGMNKEIRATAKTNGYLTIYLTLSLTAILAVVMVLLMGIRKNTVRMEEELALDTAGWSALAEYHQELLKQYDLFFIDTSYGSAYPEVAVIGEHIKIYINKNLQDTKLMESRVKLTGIQEAQAAADDGGLVLEQQIIEYMKSYYGIKELEKLLSEYQPALPGQITEGEELLKQRDDNEIKLDHEPPPVKKVKKYGYNHETGKTEMYEVEEEVPIENPADHVNSLRNKGVLNLVVKEPEKLSGAAVSLEEYISHRTEKMTGTGPIRKEAEENLLSELESRALLDAYIFQKFGYFGHKKEGAALDYQIEYLLGQKSSDVENLKAVIHKLLMFREAANAIYLFTDTEKRAEISAMASSVAAVAVAPYLEPMLEISILFAWSYIESLQDVKILLENGKIPLIKTADDWNTGLNSILDFEDSLVSKETSKGLDYGQYLAMFLYVENKQELLLSMMDIMEMDIRKTPYNENFRMDGCVSGFRVTVGFESNEDELCTFDRIYIY